ncbi:MAG: hypothetical protein CFH28_00305 [Alphaproteobacteria bacterium MarineAlpha6_Bin6]|nr:MAG: hypothetical protein CFH28_00305 [Alphaproteobacteria bacterium MarineAlpha6_Bin6]PPR32876.1 MAG: hypothetical protein CFH27_00990 [Alphaproteobacteria bacterium MarineAlpha6_Bin5]|tara:strand:- start:150 stop:2705 length:2556 start_codon:yes stop_codon:yes gene_type:complete
MTNFLINWVLTYSKRFIFFILLLTVAAGCFIYKNISVNTSNTDLLSKELTFRKNDIAFKKEFPQFSNNIMIVIDAKNSDIAKDIASSLYTKIKKKEGLLFNDIFYPDEIEFFKNNGLLYLSEEKLEKRLDEMINYQPFISRLSQDQTFYGLLNTINLFLSAELSDSYANKINKLLKNLTEQKSLTWGDLFSNDNIKNYREIIYLQPILDYSKFFPSEEPLLFLDNQIQNIKKNYEHIKYKNLTEDYNFKIRLSGTVPMEQDELNTLGGGAKIGVTISLILVFIFLFYAFKNSFYLLASFLTLIIGLIWTTTFALLLFQELNLISIAFAILFIGLGIDFSIHYLLRTYEFSIKEFKFFLISTNNSIANALFLTSIAIAIGFFSFAFTPFKGLGQLGIIAGTGMFISLFLTLFFLPSFLIFIKKVFNPKRNIFKEKSLKDFYFVSFMTFFKRNSKFFFILSSILFLFSVFNLKNIEFNNDPLKLRNQESVSVITMNELIKDKSINPHSVDILVDRTDQIINLKKELNDLSQIKEINFFDDLVPQNQDTKLEILSQFKTFFPEISLNKSTISKDSNFTNKENELLISIENIVKEKYSSIIDIKYIDKLKAGEYSENIFYFFEENIKDFNDSLKAKKILKENIPDSIKSRYLSKNGKIRVEIVPAKNLNDQINKKEFVETVFEVAPNVSGGAFTTYSAGKTILNSFIEAMVISIFLTTLFLFFTLRSFKKVFIVFINLVAALLFSLTFLTFLGINLNFANIIALPLLFGLGAATSIQTILRIDKFKTLDDYFLNSTTPRAIVFSLLTTLGTFFVLSLSSHVGTASMGKLLIISIFSIYLANLTILLPLEKYFFKK